MDFELKALPLEQAARFKADALVALVPETGWPGDDPVAQLARDALQTGHFEAKPGKMLQTYRTAGVSATQLLLAGCGDASGRRTRTAVQAAVAAVRGRPVRRLAIALAPGAGADAVRAAVMAAAEATYAYVATRSKPDTPSLEKVTLLVGSADAAVKAAFQQARATAAGMQFAREMGNLPPNIATPTRLGDEARKLAKAHGFQCEVLGPREVARLGMGSFMAVAQGSEQPLRFIVLRHQGGPAGQAPVVLVGKGITFDSGGISIKPAPEMDEMKFDMCGAASVLGVFRALGESGLPLNVVGLIPACENLPDGKSFKPGDVVTSMSGQTIEVLNTDAEGRLILCDALTYAARFKPQAVIDIATLTGACVIALGAVRSGLFSTDDTLAAALQSAGDEAFDPCWRMPLDDEYGEGLKTNFADVANVAGRQAGAVTAAKFLQRFAGQMPWAHLDIAGTAWRSGAAKGATGRPVPLLMQYLQEAAARQPAVRRRRSAGS